MLLNMKFWVVLDVHLFVTKDVSMLNSTSRAVLQLAENLNFVLLCIMAKKHCYDLNSNVSFYKDNVPWMRLSLSQARLVWSRAKTQVREKRRG